MIRINLLSEGRRPVVARSAKPKLSFGDHDPSLFILAAGLVVGILFSGVWFLSINSEMKDWEERVRQAQAEVKQLEPFIKKVEEFKKRQTQLNRKIDVIQDLTAKQSGPVHVMDQVSRCLPDLLWLTSMEMKGGKIKLAGQAFNTNAIAQLIENLKNAPGFGEPEDTPVTQSQSLYTFSLSVSYTVPKPESKDAEAEGDAGDPTT